MAASLSHVPCIQPRLAQSASGLCSVAPGHPAYEEIGKLDPRATGSAWCELRPGIPVQIGLGITRVTDERGLNHYMVGSEEKGFELLDAGREHYIAEERIVVAQDLASLSNKCRTDAQWFAPIRGHLVRLDFGEQTPDE